MSRCDLLVLGGGITGLPGYYAAKTILKSRARNK